MVTSVDFWNFTLFEVLLGKPSDSDQFQPAIGSLKQSAQK
jgi:hypothetical protein